MHKKIIEFAFGSTINFRKILLFIHYNIMYLSVVCPTPSERMIIDGVALSWSAIGVSEKESSVALI